MKDDGQESANKTEQQRDVQLVLYRAYKVVNNE